MQHRAVSPFAMRLLAALAATLCASCSTPHRVDCGERSGIDLARCERHQQMAARCGALDGDAHFACDREFLLAHPLQCGRLAGDDMARCAAEVAAVQACEPSAGREFLLCVRERIQASPMGRH